MSGPAIPLSSITPRHYSRTKFPRVAVASEIPADLNEELLSAVHALNSNRARIIQACIEAGLPIVLARAADRQQQD